MPNTQDSFKTFETGLSDLMDVAAGFSALASLIDSRCFGDELILQSSAQGGLAYVINMLRDKLYKLSSDMDCAAKEIEAFGREVRS